MRLAGRGGAPGERGCPPPFEKLVSDKGRACREGIDTVAASAATQGAIGDVHVVSPAFARAANAAGALANCTRE